MTTKPASAPAPPPCLLLDLDTLAQVSGRPALLSDCGLRSLGLCVLHGPPEIDLKGYRSWLFDEIKRASATDSGPASPAVVELVRLIGERDRLWKSGGRALTLGYVGADARPFAEVVAKCLDYLRERGIVIRTA